MKIHSFKENKNKTETINVSFSYLFNCCSAHLGMPLIGSIFEQNTA